MIAGADIGPRRCDGPVHGGLRHRPAASAAVEIAADAVVDVCSASGTRLSASFTESASYSASNVCDGKASTSWSTWAPNQGAPAQAVLTAGFSGAWNISSVSFSIIEGTTQSFQVEARDSEGVWTELASEQPPAGGRVELTVDAPDATGIRVVFQTPGSYVKVNNMSLEGTASDAPGFIDWQEIIVDGNDVERDEAGAPFNTFGGFGAVSANNTSSLLVDYKEEHPDVYWNILHAIFDEETGAGLNHIKLELGGDVDTSSGAEPATKRAEDEPADVLRGAGFHLVADARTINPDINVEALRWAEPSWTEGDYDKCFAWYLETMEAAYDTFGIEFTYMSPSQNEVRGRQWQQNELDWTVWFAKALAEQANAEDARYDYSDIRIVALDS
ncbi:hypothetical protein [Microbacterium amylolyticum]|uniref:Glycosyl hydrolase family 59 catalytic domain-containing protein n=1 Tax=Microbacterium amylolyticum TaxID=936337 RepID=A0ABS4ZFQ6_9MICO|nr:hypothetical protein [Microbacterium amylolyticum]MBP2436104.1 hypothetical protein [Microbacterium amylolyticum]